MKIRHTSRTTAELTVSYARYGDFITEGRTHVSKLQIIDSYNLRQFSAKLNQLRERKFNGTVTVRGCTMDSSIWCDLADALLAFTLSVDFNNLST